MVLFRLPFLQSSPTLFLARRRGKMKRVRRREISLEIGAARGREKGRRNFEAGEENDEGRRARVNEVARGERRGKGREKFRRSSLQENTVVSVSLM